MHVRLLPVALAASSLLFAGTWVWGQQQSTRTPSGHAPIATAPGQLPGPAPAGAPDGAALYASRCAMCHEHASGRVPSRAVLSQNPASFILATLRNGVMAPMAQGLSPAEMAAVAHYVSQVPDDPKANKDVDVHRIWGDGVAGTPLDGPPCKAPPPPIDTDAPAQWNGWSPTKDGARFQAHPGLTAAEVPRLKLKWAFQYPGAKNGQATVIGDRLFTTSMSGTVYALSARTGCVYWRYAAPAATRTSVTVVTLPAGAPARHALFISDWTKSAIALDADTGKPLWRTVIDDQPGEQMTGSLTYWDGKIFVPISSGNEAFAPSPAWICCKFRGALVALDALTGRALWKRYTTETPPHPFKVNAAGKQIWGPSGGSIWTAPTIDAARRLIYVGASNSYTDLPYDHADSILAISADDGRIRWARQLTAHDNYIDGCWAAAAQRPANCPSPLGPDYSIGAAPILRDLPGARQVLVAASKSGMAYGMDPAREGAELWSRRVGTGSALGGVEFGLAADATRAFVGVSDIVTVPRDRGRPGLYALDIASGRLLWSQPTSIAPTCRWKSYWCHGALSQAISAMPGAVFAGGYDGHFRGYDAASGRIVWDVDTGTDPVTTVAGTKAYGGVMDGAGPTIAGGMVFVHSGYAGRSGSTQGRDMRHADGNVLMAFSVDGR